MYAKPHEHFRWPDHIQRVDSTIGLGRRLLAGQVPDTIADLSCGDGAIAATLAGPDTTLILGDYAPGYPVTGPIEDTLSLVGEPADLFICCETLEHLDDPDTVLAGIRPRTSLLLLSTPVDELGQGDNPEHYWSWNFADIGAMVTAAGFKPAVTEILECGGVGTVYQIWGCT